MLGRFFPGESHKATEDKKRATELHGEGAQTYVSEGQGMRHGTQEATIS
jgi:hypothetical protein